LLTIHARWTRPLAATAATRPTTVDKCDRAERLSNRHERQYDSYCPFGQLAHFCVSMSLELEYSNNDAMNKPSCQAPVRRVVLDNSDALIQIWQQEGPLFVNVYLPTRYGIALCWLAI
jgi:hypothetical protein